MVVFHSHHPAALTLRQIPSVWGMIVIHTKGGFAPPPPAPRASVDVSSDIDTLGPSLPATGLAPLLRSWPLSLLKNLVHNITCGPAHLCALLTTAGWPFLVIERPLHCSCASSTPLHCIIDAINLDRKVIESYNRIRILTTLHRSKKHSRRTRGGANDWI
jgi:hypothetical protein